MNMTDPGAFHIFLYTVIALFPVTNPIGLSAPFYTMTGHMEARQRHALAWRVAGYFFLLVVSVLVFGTLVLRAFDISIGIVDIAGGLLLFHTAWNMLENLGNKPAITEDKSGEEIAFFPLTMPLTADAAVLAITLSVSNSMTHHWDFQEFVEYLSAIAGIGVVALAIGILYGSSHHTVGRLGKTGIMVVTTVTAFLLLAVAVEIFVTGVHDIARTF